MKIKTFVAALLLTSFAAYADEPKCTELIIVKDNPSDDIYEFVSLESEPEFPGGINGLMQFLSDNIRYPDTCAEAEIEGKVIVKFTVFKDGHVGNIEVAKPVHPLLDAEAVRAIGLLPKWKPGVLDGKPVNVWYHLPINFKLQGDNPKSAESDKFVALGDEALSQGNNAHAYAYYKEAFDIIPSRFYLVEKCDSIMALDSSNQQDEFHRWAVSRLMREAKNDGMNSMDYIDNAVTLQEKILERHPNDLDELIPMEILYSYVPNHQKVSEIATRIYAILPSNEIGTLVDAMAFDTASRYTLGDYQGVVNLVKPKLDILFSQSPDNRRVDPMVDLADAFIMLSKPKEAEKVIDRIKAFVPDIFEQILKYHAVSSPETHTKFLELSK